MWSLGCLFGELLKKKSLFKSDNDIPLIGELFTLLGNPTVTKFFLLNNIIFSKKTGLQVKKFQTTSQWKSRKLLA